MGHKTSQEKLPAGIQPVNDLLKIDIDKASSAMKGESGEKGTPLLHLCALGVL